MGPAIGTNPSGCVVKRIERIGIQFLVGSCSRKFLGGIGNPELKEFPTLGAFDLSAQRFVRSLKDLVTARTKHLKRHPNAPEPRPSGVADNVSSPAARESRRRQ
jgi:hypothetical protein